MSEENVELVRSTFRRGNPGRFFDLLDEEVEVDASAVGLLLDHSGLIRGKDAVVEYFRHYWGAWDNDYVLEPVKIIDAGRDRVVALLNERGRGRGSGAPFERQWAVVYTLRAGKLLRWRPMRPTRKPSKPPDCRGTAGRQEADEAERKRDEAKAKVLRSERRAPVAWLTRNKRLRLPGHRFAA